MTSAAARSSRSITALRASRQRLRASIGREMVPGLLRRFGIAPAPWSRFLVGQRKVLLDRLGITHVLDVGANVGQYGEELRRSGFTGSISSFEPGAAALATLRERADCDPRWFVYGTALGETKGPARLMTWPGPASAAASLHEPTSRLRSILGNPIEQTVDVTTLDSWLAGTNCDPASTLLKMDVQGSEAQVLGGATSALKRLAAIEVELPLQQLYDGQSSMGRMLAMLDERGFTPVSVMTERFHSGWLGAVDVDALFIKNELSPLHQNDSATTSGDGTA